MDSCQKENPFQATRLWNGIVSYLETEVPIKKRRIGLTNRIHESSFSGADAVNCILKKLQEDKLSQSITREKACRLCSLLMKKKIFQPISFTSKIQAEFHDSATKYYQLVEKQDMTMEIPARIVEPSEMPMTEVNNDGNLGLTQEILNITGTLTRRGGNYFLRKVTPSRLLFSRSPSPKPKCSLPTISAELEVWWQVILGQLLSLVELPHLDKLISYQVQLCKKSTAKQSFSFSNEAFRDDSLACSTLCDDGDDGGWIAAATSCLEMYSGGQNVIDVAMGAHSDFALKMNLYFGLVDFAKQKKLACWPDAFHELLLAVYFLIGKDSEESSVKSLCLCTFLLSDEERRRLRILLEFIYIASQENSIKINIRQSNQVTVLSNLRPLFAKGNKVLSDTHVDRLITFMTAHIENIFTLPSDIQSLIQQHLTQLACGVQAAPLNLTFCQQVSSEIYKKQVDEKTEVELTALINTILNNVNIPLKEKKEHLKQLQKSHCEVFNNHFKNVL